MPELLTLCPPVDAEASTTSLNLVEVVCASRTTPVPPVLRELYSRVWSTRGLSTGPRAGRQSDSAAWDAAPLAAGQAARRLQPFTVPSRARHDGLGLSPALTPATAAARLAAIQCCLSLMSNPEPDECVPPCHPEDASIEYLLTRLRASHLPYAASLAERLRVLCAADEEDDAPPSAASLSGLLSFLQAQPRLRCPEVAMSPEGQFTAQWRREADANVVLLFRNALELQFVVFAPGALNTCRVSGVAAPSDAWKIIATVGADAWCVA